MKNNNLVYDVPTRIFHWIFAGLFVFAFAVGKLVDSETLLFSYHMLAGLILVFAVTLRIIWGFIGTKHARFSDFALNPLALFGYLGGIVSGKKEKWSGHNPASSWAAIIMFILAIGLGITGYLMSQGDTETYEDVHELLANSFLIVAILHVAGVLLHLLRHRDALPLSMITGNKSDIPIADRIPNQRAGVGILFFGLLVAFGVHLAQNFDTTTQTLNLFGTTLQLGEAEDDFSGGGEQNEGADEDEDDDDGDDD